MKTVQYTGFDLNKEILYDFRINFFAPFAKEKHRPMKHVWLLFLLISSS